MEKNTNQANTSLNTDNRSLYESKQVELTNLKKRSKILRVIAKIIEICNYVGAGLCALAAVIMAVAPQHWNIIMSDNKLESFFTSEEKAEFLRGIERISSEQWAIVASLIMSVIGCMILAVIFRYVWKTFREIEDGDTPFTGSITGRIKVCGIIGTIFVLLNNGLIEAVIAGLVFAAIYTIFRYGVLLQTESDETV